MEKPLSQVESVLNPVGFEKPPSGAWSTCSLLPSLKHRLQDVQNFSNEKVFHLYSAEHCVCLLLIVQFQLQV